MMEQIPNVNITNLEKFKKMFVDRCLKEGTDRLQLTYNDLARLSGLSNATVFKIVRLLEQQGFLKKIRTSESKRFANTYVLKKGELNPDSVSPISFNDGKELIDSVTSMMEEIDALQKENESLRAALGKVNIITKSQLPGGLTQLIYQIAEDPQ